MTDQATLQLVAGIAAAVTIAVGSVVAYIVLRKRITPARSVHDAIADLSSEEYIQKMAQKLERDERVCRRRMIRAIGGSVGACACMVAGYAYGFDWLVIGAAGFLLAFAGRALDYRFRPRWDPLETTRFDARFAYRCLIALSLLTVLVALERWWRATKEVSSVEEGLEIVAMFIFVSGAVGFVHVLRKALHFRNV